MTVDPDVYVVLDEKLFLFSNAEARPAFENEEPGIVQVADSGRSWRASACVEINHAIESPSLRPSPMA